jgi:alpha-ribazole phosphatase
MNLHLIRHTSLNIPSGVCYGQSDVDVSTNFEIECSALISKLDGIQFDAVYASPLQRCTKLARALNLGEMQVDDRLKELHFGDWEMQPWESIPRDVFDVWAQDYAHLSPPNGESFTQLYERTKTFTAEVSSRLQGKNVAVVTHGGVIRAMLADALNMPLKGLFRLVIDHASVTQITWSDPVPRIHFVNR